jgi:dTDP-4-dehydrorhamnose 3,5-epimerase
MIFEPLPLEGAWQVRLEKASDERGYFARILCVKEFAAHGLNGAFVQASVSHNRQRGTVRGMHFQWPPSREAKLVRCIHGAIQDFLVDLRPDSPTFLEHTSVVLDPAEGNAVYIPSGFAHGFQALSDDALIQYHMTDEFRPDLAGGLRWDDPALGLSLPLPVSTIAARDLGYAPFDAAGYAARYREGLAEAATP